MAMTIRLFSLLALLVAARAVQVDIDEHGDVKKIMRRSGQDKAWPEKSSFGQEHEEVVEDQEPAGEEDEDDEGSLEQVEGDHENCAASMAVDPRFCSVPRGLCRHIALKVGDMVPMRIKVRNMCNYEKWGDSVYIPGQVRQGKRFLIDFGSDDAFEYVSFQSSKAPSSTFSMGNPPDDFKGHFKCKAETAAQRCGYMTMGDHINVGPRKWQTIGIVMMRAKKKVTGSIIARVTSEVHALRTHGGICGDNELAASAMGTCGAKFADSD